MPGSNCYACYSGSQAPAVMWDWVGQLAEAKRNQGCGVLVTLTSVKGSAPREVGAKMWVNGDGTFLGTIGGGNLERLAIEDARQCLKEGLTRGAQYKLCSATGQCCGGIVEMFFEVIGLHPHLYIFGAGHVGGALARTMLGTPFQIHLIDERPEWIRSDRIPKEVERHPVSWQEFVERVQWDEKRTFTVVMTHSHPRDQAIIGEVIRRPAKYIGLIGSRNKWLDFQLHLGKAGATREELLRVHCPIGEKLAGKAPQEVAISIAAELLKIHYEDKPKDKKAYYPLRREVAEDGGTQRVA